MVSVFKLVTREKSADILIELLNSGELTVSEILKRVGGSASTIIRRIRELIDFRLIVEKSSEKWPYKKILRLTDYGKKVAKLIRAIKLDEVKVLKQSPARWILLLAYLTGGAFESLTRLVKFMFILKEEYGFKIDYDFVWYKYGPFSKDILFDLDAMELLGFIRIDERLLGYNEIDGEPIIKKTIRLTEKGRKLAADLLFSTPQGHVNILKDIIDRFYKISLRQLKEYVYSKYGQQTHQEISI